jgi:hypothetical protein
MLEILLNVVSRNKGKNKTKERLFQTRRYFGRLVGMSISSMGHGKAEEATKECIDGVGGMRTFWFDCYTLERVGARKRVPSWFMKSDVSQQLGGLRRLKKHDQG